MGGDEAQDTAYEDMDAGDGELPLAGNLPQTFPRGLEEEDSPREVHNSVLSSRGRETAEI